VGPAAVAEAADQAWWALWRPEELHYSGTVFEGIFPEGEMELEESDLHQVVLVSLQPRDLSGKALGQGNELGDVHKGEERRG